MSDKNERVRVLYSFPLRLGAERICTTAWHQVNGLAEAGADVLVFPASISRPVDPSVRVSPNARKREASPSVPDRGYHARSGFARQDCGAPNPEIGGAD